METKDFRESLNGSYDMDPKYSESMVQIDYERYLSLHEKGEESGDSANVLKMAENFSWKRGFVNTWTGHPNMGKTTFFMFMALVQAKSANWKWCIFPPEMLSAYRFDGKTRITAEDIHFDLVYMLTGLCPWRRYAHKYRLEMIDEVMLMKSLKWIEEHFIIVYPKEKTYKSLIDNFRYFYEYYGVDGFLIDPFKNLQDSVNERTDIYLNRIFAECKDFALETNSSFNFVAHPRSGNVRNEGATESERTFKIATQYDLSGGAAWDQSMDGIYSIYRPNRHIEPNDGTTEFYNLKQRKAQLVGKLGVVEDIFFDWRSNRFFFDGVCPVDKNASINFKNPSDQVQSQFHQKSVNFYESQKEQGQEPAPF